MNDVCPGCKKYKLELEVMFHRDAAAVPVPVPAAISGTSPRINITERVHACEMSQEPGCDSNNERMKDMSNADDIVSLFLQVLMA